MIVKMLRGSKAQAVGREATSNEVKAGEQAGRQPRVFHPFLIAIFPIMSLYAHNVYEAQPWALALPIALVLSSTFVIWLVLRLISRNASSAGLAASLLVASFFSYKVIYHAAYVVWSHLLLYWVYKESPPDPLVVVGLMAIVVGTGMFWIFRRLRRPERWTGVLNVFTLILVAMPTFSAVSTKMRQPSAAHREVALPPVVKRGWTPDIYFIILDGYARGDVMKELYGFDNDPFLRRLEQQGFFVARQSYSNYCHTRLSVASTLNADYLGNLIDLSSSDLLPLGDLIKGSLVRKTLEPLGYRFVTFPTGFDATDFPDQDKFPAPRPGLAEFAQLLFEMTPLDAWLSEVKQEDRFSALRDRTLFLLDHLADVTKIDGPTFTFAHVVAPHPPFVFGEHGEDVSPRRVQADGSYKRMRDNAFDNPDYVRHGYHDESVYITERIEQAIGKILANSPEPPVIILQSDHGSWLRYHPDDVEATDVRERFGILNCIYLPDRKVEGFSDTMTSVNTFRIVLKEVVRADLPLLPERSYFSPINTPLTFTDVTDRLHSRAERDRKFTYPSNYAGVDQQF
jgi:hypothetical protein